MIVLFPNLDRHVGNVFSVITVEKMGVQSRLVKGRLAVLAVHGGTVPL
jgi:hypothetical protein